MLDPLLRNDVASGARVSNQLVLGSPIPTSVFSNFFVLPLHFAYIEAHTQAQEADPEHSMSLCSTECNARPMPTWKRAQLAAERRREQRSWRRLMIALLMTISSIRQEMIIEYLHKRIPQSEEEEKEPKPKELARKKKDPNYKNPFASQLGHTDLDLFESSPTCSSQA
eukprot:s4601_g6.t1